ncbi:5-hydroxytryptamine receptor 1A-alpha-like [Galleria mellonella]|uniref:5-hydroxytryptamine receptor 1A-alpha-like n=1 Tax=Galleria mellonella TaxID=7137 RepID=A0A6J1WEN9_GALME|nr:5-hydroxytryptamine receptor 1A-alpha-like [Galleria mellonella]
MNLKLNHSEFKSNVTLDQVMEYFNLSITNITNKSDVSQIHLFDLYEAYSTKEKEQLLTYKVVAYVLGTLIILSNLIVVISSGLILKKGQQHKSTYLLLGNVSLADTIIGISIIFGATIDNNINSDPLCIFQLGMLVCPTMVSIFSVGFIAVDRYIYILHGLYYQRWFNTTRVRIGILCIWIIGITLGFMPLTGWVTRELYNAPCVYIAVFPGSLILFNSFLSVIPIILVAILYTIILIKALKNLAKLKTAQTSVVTKTKDKPKLRIYRGNIKPTNTISVKYPLNSNTNKLKRSISFNTNYVNENSHSRQKSISFKAKSIDDLTISNTNISKTNQIKDELNQSEFSIQTIESTNSDNSLSLNSPTIHQNKSFTNKNNRSKEPNKCRAVTVVMLTSFSFIATWMPFFIIVIFYVLCEEKTTNDQCLMLRKLLNGPAATLAFFNSVLNPLIYAWWHKGFKRSLKSYYRNYFQKYLKNRCDFTEKSENTRTIKINV